MPIKGLTDREEGAFPQIGIIRKGAPKTQNAPGKDLPYFRVEFDDKEISAAQDFVARFSNAPTDITIMLPFNEIDRCWEAWRETYVAGAMVHRCDGEYVRYSINAKTGEKLVLNSLSLSDGRPVACKGKPDGCKPVGRLRVIIPELQRLAYLVVMTTSIHDIINISNQLKAIAQMTNGRIAGIPLVLRRRPKKISTPSGENGKRARREKWLVSIEADPEWVRAQLAKMHHDALPGNGFDIKQIEPPIQHSISGPSWDENEDDEPANVNVDYDGEVIDSCPELKDEYNTDHTGGNGKTTYHLPSDAMPMPKTMAEAYKQGAIDDKTMTDRAALTEEGVKPAKLRYQPFVAWANEWVRGNGKAYARDNEPMLANMWHLLNRIGALGFSEVTQQNADDIKATLESFVKLGEPDKAQA